MESELYEFELDEHRKKLMKNLYLWSKMLLFFSIGTGLFDIFSSYKLWIFYSKMNDVPGVFKVQSTMNIIFLALYGVCLPLQAIFFYRFASNSKAHITENNTNNFNRSFKWLLKQTILGTLLFGLNTIWGIINITLLSRANSL